MDKRQLLKALGAAASAPLLPFLPASDAAAASFNSRVRPGDPAWPGEVDWALLNAAVGGRLETVTSPLDECRSSPEKCADLFRQLKNPYFLGDTVGLTQTLGWVDAWTSQPSAYAVAAETPGDVVAAIDFAREHRLRLVVKGGGHSYQGTSNAPDSLLVWTRRMKAVTLHDAFVPVGCEGKAQPRPAVTVGAGAIWGQVYDEVVAKAGRYVQGGGCMTVGVAGLVQSGGFGSFSKRYGTAAASLLQAEVVTSDGHVRIANACNNPDLFWALKGGGGGSLGIVTKVTLATHPLPEFFGGAFMDVKARSDGAYRRLVAKILDFYRTALFNPHWGEQIAFRRDNVLSIAMVFQGIGQAEADAVWQPFRAFVEASPQDFAFEKPPQIIALPARSFWDPAFLKTVPGLVMADDRPGAPAGNVFWAGNLGEAGQVLHAYQSAWLPASLLEGDKLANALFAASRHWRVSLHTNKGLAGAPAEAVEAARDTAMNPAVLDAFALLISGADGPPAYPGIPGREPDAVAARDHAAAVGRAMDEVRKLLPAAGSYVSESNYFDSDWRTSYWGANYDRLLVVKDKYDPTGLFIVHNGVGSERWSADGFTRNLKGGCKC